VAALARRRLRTRTAPRVTVHVLPFGRALAFLSQVFRVEPRWDPKSKGGSRTTSSRTEEVG
jgi:hypothetical protein